MGVVLQLNSPQDNYIGGDATASNNGINLHSGLGSFLLYRFELDATLDWWVKVHDLYAKQPGYQFRG